MAKKDKAPSGINGRVKPIVSSFKNAHAMKPYALICAALAVVLAACSLVLSVASMNHGTEPGEAAVIEEVQHEHNWTPVYTYVHHEAVTDEVIHPAEYENATSYHTVCVVCGDQIDGKVEEHRAATEHEGYATNVPFDERKIVEDAWTETVVIEDPWDEQVYDHALCSSCGETLYSAPSEEYAVEPAPLDAA